MGTKAGLQQGCYNDPLSASPRRKIAGELVMRAAPVAEQAPREKRDVFRTVTKCVGHEFVTRQQENQKITIVIRARIPSIGLFVVAGDRIFLAKFDSGDSALRKSIRESINDLFRIARAMLRDCDGKGAQRSGGFVRGT